MPYQSSPRVLVLHGLRLKGAAEAQVVAASAGLTTATVDRQLGDLAGDRLVTYRSGLLAGWSLTPAGRRAHELMLQQELDEAGARPVVESAYEDFRGLNGAVLEACSRWQVREVAGRLVRNDHRDVAYDTAVLDDLDAATRPVLPALEALAGTLVRFRGYGTGLVEALARARGGDVEHVAGPLVGSVHTIWFELHEDLLASLGRERSSEVVV